eukprot:229006-Pleurochrysis_carterae.AAC.1
MRRACERVCPSRISIRCALARVGVRAEAPAAAVCPCLRCHRIAREPVSAAACACRRMRGSKKTFCACTRALRRSAEAPPRPRPRPALRTRGGSRLARNAVPSHRHRHNLLTQHIGTRADTPVHSDQA